ncbi:MAG: ester cyclase [Solirubrobacterales bacterium]
MNNGEDNEALVRALFENASAGRFEALQEIVADDYIVRPENVRGPDGLREMIEGYREALSDLRVAIDQQFTQGDFVATRYRIQGTHDGELMGTPATGKAVEFSGITISRCEGGRITEEWELVDTMGLLTQIGALPQPAAS